MRRYNPFSRNAEMRERTGLRPEPRRSTAILFRIPWIPCRAGAGLHLCPILMLMILLCAKHNPAMGMIMIPSKIRCDLVMGRAFAMRCESGFGAESRPLGMIAPRSAATALK